MNSKGLLSFLIAAKPLAALSVFIIAACNKCQEKTLLNVGAPPITSSLTHIHTAQKARIEDKLTHHVACNIPRKKPYYSPLKNPHQGVKI